MCAYVNAIIVLVCLLYTSIALSLHVEHWKKGNVRNHGLISFTDRQTYWLHLFWPAYIGFFVLLIAMAWFSQFYWWVREIPGRIRLWYHSDRTPE